MRAELEVHVTLGEVSPNTKVFSAQFVTMRGKRKYLSKGYWNPKEDGRKPSFFSEIMKQQ